MNADLVLLNANIITMNLKKPHAEAIAIKKDRILKVGKTTDIIPLINKDAKVLELHGKTILPGFIDTHIHIADFGRTLNWLDLKHSDSIQAIQEAIKQKAQTKPKNKWILGSGWNQNNLKEKRQPTRQDLDEVAPDNPVVIYHQLGRTCTTNTKALRKANITQNTPNPKNGTIDKNPQTNQPTGILHGNATDLVWNKIPPPTQQETLKSTKNAIQKIIEAGITTAHWIISTTQELAIAQKLTQQSMALRIYNIITADLLETLRNTKPNKNIPKVDAILIFTDGYLASQTAALNEPYTDNPTNKGALLYTQDELDRLVAKIQQANLQVIIHATGDKAIEAALKSLEANPPEHSKNKKPHRLEQAAVLNKQLIQRIKKQNLIISIQPQVIQSEFTTWQAAQHLGNKRAKMLYPTNTLLGRKIVVAGGSDCPMEPLNPLTSMQSAATREFSNERITFEDALRLYTVNAAHTTSEENVKGSLEEGKLADLTVLSNDPTTIAPDKIANIKVELTIIGGKVLYQRKTS
jgi:predicted amidohydrolase YtcJ